MASKSKTLAMTKFYNEPVKVKELHTGFLYKSPPSSAVTKVFLQQKSWKRRFFVLFKIGDGYQLIYYTNEKKEKTLGKISLSMISLLFTSPQTNPQWDWIQKHFKCPPSHVLFLRVATRDYFLIGETSEDADAWHNAINTVLKTMTIQMQNTDDTPMENRARSISAPEPKDEDQPDNILSKPDTMLTSSPKENHYDYPRKLSEPPAPPPTHMLLANMDMDENDEEDEDEEEEEASEYMVMGSLQTALDDKQKEEDTAKTNPSINGHKSTVCNGEVNHEELFNKWMSTDIFKPLVNGNSASTKLNGAPLNKSETCTHVEKEICISQKSLKNSLVLTQEEGKPCVSEYKDIQDSSLLHKGDQILAFNDLLIDTVDEIQTYLRRLSKDEVKLTIRRPMH